MANPTFIEYGPECEFPVQNLPYGCFTSSANAEPHIATAIGDQVLDLNALAEAGLLPEEAKAALQQSTLNAFMALGQPVWRAVRQALGALLDKNCPTLRDNATLRERAFFPMGSVTMVLPANIGDYTDFYASRNHATNVGIMFRGKDNALQPNWTWLPVGYHGRSSSVNVSPDVVHRPVGQTRNDTTIPPLFQACKIMDFELEMGFFVGPGNKQGDRIKMEQASQCIFGMVLLNDWSARDLQKWEYVPLGPFTAKNFATTISPWIVTMDALEPFRIQGEKQDPAPLPYLAPASDKSALDIKLEVKIKPANWGDDVPAAVVCKSNARHLYWSNEQMLVHHSVTGCPMRPGDLLGTGTISGVETDSFGSMLELSWKGEREVNLASANGDAAVRKFLADNDTVIMTGVCEGAGYRIGFGECVGKVMPAKE